MIANRNITIIIDGDGKKLVLINDIRFKGKRNINWDEVKEYLKGYVGDFYEIAENANKIYIGNDFVKEFTGSESRTALAGARAKAKANSAIAIPELIQIATNSKWENNKKEKHIKERNMVGIDMKLDLLYLLMKKIRLLVIVFLKGKC